jgi:hypothetical protein
MLILLEFCPEHWTTTTQQGTALLERNLVRNRVKRKATEDISSRAAKVITNNELFASNDENLKPSDITSLRQALYRERPNKFPKLPSSIEEVSDILNFLKPINTSKDEDLLLVNDADSRIVIFSSPTNLKFFVMMFLKYMLTEQLNIAPNFSINCKIPFTSSRTDIAYNLCIVFYQINHNHQNLIKIAKKIKILSIANIKKS